MLEITWFDFVLLALALVFTTIALGWVPRIGYLAVLQSPVLRWASIPAAAVCLGVFGIRVLL